MILSLLLAAQLTFTYEKPDTTPIVFSADVKGEEAKAVDFCLWLDVIYEDGSATWGTGLARKECRPGTHDWERTVGVFRPKKPVKRIDFSTLFRGPKTSGKGEYRNATLERREPKAGEPTPEPRPSDYPYRGEPRSVKGLSDAASVVWTADSTVRVTPRTFPGKAAPRGISLELAGRERESAQICVTAGRSDAWTAGDLEVSVLKDDAGRPFPGRVYWQRIGYVPRQLGGGKHSLSPEFDELWLPDPLLPAAPFRVRGGSTQGLWLTAAADADAFAGTYRGVVRVLRDGKEFATVPITLRVRGFSLPQTFGCRYSLSVMDGFTRFHYPDAFKAKRHESWDLMLDHRLSPDDISRFTLPDLDELEYAKKRGMCLFNLLNIVPEPKDPNTLIVYTTTKEVLFSDWFYPQFRDRLVPYVKELRRRGLADMAYVYGFDEQEKEYFPAIEKFWKSLQRDLPCRVPLMSTSRAYRDIAACPTNPPPSAYAGDWMCPLTADWRDGLSEDLRKRGKKVWWYTCLSPVEPYANFANIEYPFADGRLLGWMTHLWRADGFLFWVVNFWPKDMRKLDERDTFFPDFDIRIGDTVHGDGVLLYPGRQGVLPSIRLANVRDGEEDAEWLQAAEAVAGRKSVESLGRRLVCSLTDFDRDAARIRSVRSAVGDLIENGRRGKATESKGEEK